MCIYIYICIFKVQDAANGFEETRAKHIAINMVSKKHMYVM